MVRPKVVALKIPYGRMGGVQETVRRAMKLAEWDKFVIGKKIALKVNLISDQMVPGQCTSPWVLEGVIQQIQETKPDAEITICDADLAAAHQCDKAAEIWGHKELAEKYGARFVNLSRDQGIKVKVNGSIFKELEIPQTIIETDDVITMPLLKTHCLSMITCALKSQWGTVNRTVRHQYHLVFNEAIADVNLALKDKIKLAVVDGTIGLEGNAPRTGHPRICNLIMVSSDLVACDAVAATIMGFKLDEVKYIKLCAERGIGSLQYHFINDIDTLPPPFDRPNPRTQPIFFWELYFRRTKLKKLLFDTKMFSLMSWIATQYNSILWYQWRGKKYAREIVQDPYYRLEFGKLFEEASRVSALGKILVKPSFYWKKLRKPL